MTQEDKQLLLKDLCARLLYGVKIKFDSIKETVFTISELGYLIGSNHDIIPYLRPMSSMTDEEIGLYRSLSDEIDVKYGPNDFTFNLHHIRLGIKPDDPHECIDEWINMEAIDWLNAHHFDYRGLIDIGLALEASEDMYKHE